MTRSPNCLYVGDEVYFDLRRRPKQQPPDQTNVLRAFVHAVHPRLILQIAPEHGGGITTAGWAYVLRERPS
jgi:hypothetical protein